MSMFFDDRKKVKEEERGGESGDESGEKKAGYERQITCEGGEKAGTRKRMRVQDHDSDAVSLGGKSRNKTQETKSDFVERTRKEREARESARKRENASITLQSFFRGRKVVWECKTVERRNWNNDFKQFAMLYSETTSVSSDLQSRVVKLLRRLMFFFNSENVEDDKSLTQLLLWLITGKFGSLSNAHGLESLTLLKDREALQTNYRVLKLSRLSHMRLERSRHLPPCDNHALDVSFLISLCDKCQMWGDENSGAALCMSLMKNGLMRLIGQYFTQSNSASDQNSVSTLQVLLGNLCRRMLVHSHAEKRMAYSEFCRHILTIQELFKPGTLAAKARASLLFPGMWDNVLDALAANEFALCREFCDHHELERSAYFLGNLVELSDLSIVSGSAHSTALFAECASMLLSHVKHLQSLRGQTDEDMYDANDQSVDMETMEVEVQTAAGVATVRQIRVKEKKRNFETEISPALAAIQWHVQGLCNKDYLYKLLDVIQNSKDANYAVSATCALLVQLVDFVPTSQKDVMNALAFKPSVLMMLWNRIKSFTENDQKTISTQERVSRLQYFSLLSMFCMVYHYFLVTVDNEEFYVRQYPFRLDELREMVTKIKNTLYDLYWKEADSETALKLRDAGSKLLSRLFERNCYKQYASPELWLATDRNVSIIISDLDAISAARMMDPDHVDVSFEAKHGALLQEIPFSLPFHLRVRILRYLISLDRQDYMDAPASWHNAQIRRSHVVEDGYDKLNNLGHNLKRTIQISFVNQEGLQEAGIDGGGLFKEFVNTISLQAFNPSYGLFCSTGQNLLFPNPQSFNVNPWAGSVDDLSLFEFFGRIVGKAIYDGILIELRLAPFFLRKMLGKEMFFDDLESLDPELHKNLLHLKNYDGDFEMLSLNFEVVEVMEGRRSGSFWTSADHRTCARRKVSRRYLQSQAEFGIRDIAVTADNVLQYKNLMLDYWLNKRIARQSQAFMRGISDLITPKWIRMFSPDELQMLISGSVNPVDLAVGNCRCTMAFDSRCRIYGQTVFTVEDITQSTNLSR
eukprot:745895-Hanusia_phi.AAC.2